jgi:glycosyltransferase involved in cell wall biosynthesis
MLKKVLMIAYLYPPVWEIGTMRSLKFSTYLPQEGWHPVILTVRRGTSTLEERTGPEIDVVRTRYINIRSPINYLLRRGRSDRSEQGQAALSDIKKKPRIPVFLHCKKLLQDVLFFPDDCIGWYTFGVKEGLRAIRDFNIKVIYSSSSPVTSHLIAHSLKHKTGLPWVADLRDQWTQNPTGQKIRAVAWVESILEKHILSTADAVVTVSEPLAAQLSQIHPRLSEKIQVITNGFDPEDFRGMVLKTPEKFTITYTGQLYQWRRDPEPLMAALAELLGDGLISPEEIELRFVGELNPALFSLAAKYNMEESITVTGRIPYPEALKEQQNSSILLVMVHNDTSCQGEFTGKVFEYFGAGRQILALVPQGNVIENLLEETRAGLAISPNNIPAIKEALLRWYREYKDFGAPVYSPDREKVGRYTRQNTTRILASLFNKLVKPCRD